MPITTIDFNTVLSNYLITLVHRVLPRQTKERMANTFYNHMFQGWYIAR